MKAQDEATKDRIQLPWDFLIKNLGEEFCDADQTLLQHALFQSQNGKVTGEKKPNHLIMAKNKGNLMPLAKVNKQQ